MPRPRPKPTPPDADTRGRILEAATRVFSAQGFAAARVDEIAARAKLNKATLYYHVGGKRELYTAVLTRTIDRTIEALHRAADRLNSPSEKLLAVVDTLARLGSENPAFVPMILREVASGGENLPDAMVVRMGAVFRFVAGILTEGIQTGTFRAVDPLRTHVMLVGSTLFSVASQPIQERVARIAGLPLRPFAPKELGAHVGGLFLNGLTLRGPRSRPGAARRRR